MKNLSLLCILLLLIQLTSCKNESGNDESKQETLTYKIVAKEDVSYGGTPRMVFRVVVNVDRKPSEEQLKRTAIKIWQDGNKSWKEFTVFMYLPDMDTQNIAYALGEFRPNGLKEFRIADYMLDGTRWN